MLFYKIEFESEKALESGDRQSRRVRSRLKALTADANARTKGTIAFFVSDFEDRRVSIGAALFVDAVLMNRRDLAEAFEEFRTRTRLKGKILDTREITAGEFSRMLNLADRNDYIDDDDDYKTDLGMAFIDACTESECEEVLLDTPCTKSEAIAEAKRLLCGASLIPELERIFDERSPDRFQGNPVHYVIVSDDPQVRRSVRELLLRSLLQRGRLMGRRYCTLTRSVNSGLLECFYEDKLKELYQSQLGCALAITFSLEDSGEESGHADASFELVASVASRIREFRRGTLTILEMGRSESKLYDHLMDELHGITFVRLDEELVFTREARGYLRRLAAKNGIKDCRSLVKSLPREESGYLSTDLNKLFDRWYDSYLRTELHPQYRELSAEAEGRAKKPKGDAYKDLMEMPGLRSVKEVILQAIDFHKTQKLFAGRGIGTERPSMHMVFAGNPGTAKTTVARLMARIMKDNGLLSSGGLVEVGRSDLVGKYVGWTAPLVKKKFKAAKGSVLFIDEAYSLVEDRDGLYGDEAINTIVQEMENARDETVVVFAGYPDRMREFVERNPGLRSRVAFHVDFPDYTADELMEILRLVVKKKCRALGAEAEERVRSLLESALNTPDFGNGRFVRNLVERAMMRQASRLVRLPADRTTDAELKALLAEDFVPDVQAAESHRRIVGFH